jgi:hypothetical protein
MTRLPAMIAAAALAFAASCASDPSTTPSDTTNADGALTVTASLSTVSLTRGGTADIPVTISRTALTGAVTVRAENLPAGVTAQPVTIASGASNGTIVVRADTLAAAGQTAVMLRASIGDVQGTAWVNVAVTTSIVSSGAAYTLTTSPSSVSLSPGETATVSVVVSRSGGFTGEVVASLDASGLPAGVTAPSVTIPSTSTTGMLTLTASATAAAASGTVTVRGKAAGLDDRTTALSLQLTTQPTPDDGDGDGDDGGLPGFTMTTSPATSLSVQTSGTTGILVEIERDGGFGGAVEVSVTGLPAGVTVDPITIAAGQETGTLSVKANNAAVTSKSITVRATATDLAARTKTLTLAVTSAAAPAITLSTSPASSLSIARGGTAIVQVTISRSGGFTGEVTVSAEDLPLDVSAPTIKIASSATTGTITLTAKSGAPIVSAKSIRIVATGQGLDDRTKSMTVAVGSAPEFTLTTTAATASITPGGTAAIAVKVARTGGFSGSVTVTAENLPSGVSATSSSVTIGSSGTGTITLKADVGAAAGTKSITIRGTGAGVTEKTASVALTVSTAPSFTLHTSPTSVTVSPAFPKEVNVSVVRGTGFTGSVSVSVEGLPTGVTAPGATIFSSQNGVNITFSATSSAKAGTYTVTVKAKAGTIEQTKSLALTIPEGAGYSFTITPNPISISPGGKATFTVNITRNAAMNNIPITFTLKSAPTGVGFTAFGNAIALGNSYTFEIAASQTATLGAGTITIQGNANPGGGETASAAINVGALALTVKVADASIQGWQAWSTAPQLVTITRPPNVTGQVALTLEGAPNGVTMTSDPVKQGELTTYMTLHVNSQVPIPAISHTMTLRAKVGSGASDATTTINLSLQKSVYQTEFFNVKYRRFQISSSGNKCEYDVTLSGTITATFPSLVSGTSSTLALTMKSVGKAVTAKVGTTTCTGGEDEGSTSKTYVPSMSGFNMGVPLGTVSFPNATGVLTLGSYEITIQPPTSLTTTGKSLSGSSVTIKVKTDSQNGVAGAQPSPFTVSYTRVGQP